MFLKCNDKTLHIFQVDAVGSIELEEFVLSGMNKDDISDIVKKDKIIRIYGSFLLSGKGVKRPSDISQSMRVMARLLIRLRITTNSNKSLVEFLKACHFDDILKCTREMAGYSAKNSDGELLPTFAIPSLPLKIGYGLDNLLMILHGIGIREDNQDYINISRDVQTLYKQEWPVLISSASHRSLADNKFNKCEVMPVTSDLSKVKEYCLAKLSELKEKLIKEAQLETWRELAELVVTRITIFNKRRGNEASSLLLKRFIDRKNHGKIIHDDILESLSPLEKKLIER